jgi:ADP-ribose pyrophosphatase
MADSRYEISKHHLVCENRYFSVFLDTIEKDRKTLVEDYLSVELKTCNKDLVSGVATLPVYNGKFGLIKIYRHPIRSYSWELAGGFIEPNESPVLSAVRELKEEAGVICEQKNLVDLGTFSAAPGLIACKIILFSAEHCKLAPQTQKPEFGLSRFEWFSDEKIEEYIEKGLIHDSSTVLAIYRRMKLLNKYFPPS